LNRLAQLGYGSILAHRATQSSFRTVAKIGKGSDR
jgi:hypothetical protein